MAKLWNHDHPIPWICDEKEHFFFASTGEYKLRVEKKSQATWFWNVSYKGDSITSDTVSSFVRSKQYALGLAEGVYIGHKAGKIKSDEPEIRFFISGVNDLIKQDNHDQQAQSSTEAAIPEA